MDQQHRGSVVIVGGGIAGLSAAWKLLKSCPDSAVTILEQANAPGGVLQTEKIGEYLVETAADMFTCQPETALELCRELGIENRLLSTKEPQHKAFVGLGDQVVPVPSGFSLMVPTADEPIRDWPLLSEAGKQRLLDEVNVVAREYGDDQSDEDFASFAIRRFGREAFDTLIQPLVSGIYSADPKKLSMNATMQRFVAMEKEYGSLIKAVRQKSQQESTSDARASGARYNLFRTPESGFGSLIESLVDAISSATLKTNCAVNSIERDDQLGWKVRLQTGDDLIADRVVVATPADVTASMLPATDEFDELRKELAGIESTSCAIVAMGIDRSVLPPDFDGFGIIYPHIDNGSTIAISFSSNKFAGRAPDGKVLLRFFIGGAMQEDLVDRNDDELVEISLEQFEKSFGNRPNAEFTKVFRWRKAMPQYFVGHLERVARIENLVAKADGLELAGKSYRGVGIPACIASGFAAADRIAQRWTSVAE